MASLFEAYITNLGKYNEGELVGETLKFPTTTEEVQALLKRIGVDGVRYEEFFITSFDGDVLGLYDNVVGKYAKADLAVGDYILAAKLSDAPAAENAYLYNLDGTKQAISVTIKSFATGLSGKLQSGDIVSVIVADYPEDGETTIPAELQYVEIISVTASTGYDANTGEATGEEKELPSTVTFLVLPEQAKVLAELEQVAKLHLALVYRGTTDGARQFIEAQDALIEELYAEPEEDPIEEGEAADPTAEMPESEVTG